LQFPFYSASIKYKQSKEAKMKVYKGTFKKQNGEVREMVFAKLDELPESFLEARIIGASSEKQLPDGMELVWDLEADNFRIFNHNNVIEQPTEVNF
jgi:hypothetical protein